MYAYFVNYRLISKLCYYSLWQISVRKTFYQINDYEITY